MEQTIKQLIQSNERIEKDIADIKVRLTVLENRVDNIENVLTLFIQRTEEVIERYDKRFAEQDKRFAEQDKRFDRIERNIEIIKDAVITNNEKNEELSIKYTRLENRMVSLELRDRNK